MSVPLQERGKKLIPVEMAGTEGYASTRTRFKITICLNNLYDWFVSSERIFCPNFDG